MRLFGRMVCHFFSKLHVHSHMSQSSQGNRGIKVPVSSSIAPCILMFFSKIILQAKSLTPARHDTFDMKSYIQTNCNMACKKSIYHAGCNEKSCGTSGYAKLDQKQKRHTRLSKAEETAEGDPSFPQIAVGTTVI